MPLPERIERIWFIVLASAQALLAVALVYCALLGTTATTFGFGITAFTVITALFSIVIQAFILTLAIKRPQNLDYDMLLSTAAGQLLFFVQAACLSASDGSVFVAYVTRVTQSLENAVALPKSCNQQDMVCTWQDLAEAIDNELEYDEMVDWQGAKILDVALFCLVVQSSVLIVGAYQRCGLTASDDTYIS